MYMAVYIYICICTYIISSWDTGPEADLLAGPPRLPGLRAVESMSFATLRCLIQGWTYVLCLGHFQVGSYRYRSLIEGLYTL